MIANLRVVPTQMLEVAATQRKQVAAGDRARRSASPPVREERYLTKEVAVINVERFIREFDIDAPVANEVHVVRRLTYAENQLSGNGRLMTQQASDVGNLARIEVLEDRQPGDLARFRLRVEDALDMPARLPGKRQPTPVAETSFTQTFASGLICFRS